ncbi:MAG TPA: Uma2 family endonuclease [Thermomicrobiales bacterium]|jgi:Uma2 family endonuclease
MVAEPRVYLTPEAYLDLERQGAEKHEYIDGTLVAMVGGSEQHGLIQVGISSLLRAALRSRGCYVYPSDVRIGIPAANIYTYPDISVVCGPRQFAGERRDTLLNPILLVEILSPSTERYDRGKKFAHYRRIPTLQEYVLVAQDAPLIEHYVRQPDGTWRWAAVEGLDETITLPTIGCTLPFAEVYDQVEFSTEE